MQAKQMADSLHQLAPILEECGSSEQANVLRKLADALAQAGTKAVSPVVRQVDKRLPMDNGSAGSAAASLVERISLVCVASGSKAPATDFAGVAALLRRFGATSGEEVFMQVSAALLPPARRAKTEKKPTVDIRALADELTSQAQNNQRFDELVEELSKLPKATLASVASNFLGYERSYKTKADILKAIRARQLQDAIEASRERRISRIAV